MRTDLQISHLNMRPGSQSRVSIEVTNTADVIDVVTAIVDGINPDWVQLERPLVRLFPDATDSVSLLLDIPRSCPAGDYLVIVRIVSTIDPGRQSVHNFWLTVEAVADHEIHIHPSIVTGGPAALLTARVVNTGNAASSIRVSATEPTREIDCRLDAAEFVVPQGHDALVDIDLRGPRPWFGQPVPRTITIAAEADGVVVEELATFNQKPKIPRGLITALILAAIILLWALIFWWVVSALRATEDPTKQVGTDFMTGKDFIPLSEIAASFNGTTTATTTGEGIPRVTVEAFRMIRGEAVEEGSAATDDQGLYELEALLPGEYKLRFGGEGYANVWYPDRASEDDAQVLRVEALEDKGGIDLRLEGQPGRLVGQIDLPADSPPGAPVTVTATQIVERSDGQVSDDPAVEPVTDQEVTTDGQIDLEGLPTPATYQITVEGEGFQIQQFQQTLSGGEATVLNTVSIGAASGSIAGVVVDPAGNRLGDVDVTARAGSIEVRATTPTAGDVGTYNLIDLPTPQTYVLTFEATGFSGETLSLSLQAGQSQTGINATLIGGSGTVTGTVVSTDLQPLGGIPVRVVGDGFVSETSTLTSNGSGGAAGSFEMTELPITGEVTNYTITVGDETTHQPETLGASFTSAGTQPLGQITLRPVSAALTGTVTDGSTGLGEVTITLSNGIRPSVTTSASNPPGRFAFTNVAAGSSTVTFEATGYVKRVVIVELAAGDTTDINVALTKS
jgi:hypothetical protein